MSSSYEFIHNSILSSDEDIIAHCEKLKFPPGTTIADPSTHSIIAWIKCSTNVTVGEAQMQHWTAIALCEAGVSHVRAAPVSRALTADYHGHPIGCIAMEYIEGKY